MRAYGMFQEDVKGTLVPGKYADLIVLSNDPLAVPVDSLPEIEVLVTLVGGEVEFCMAGAEDVSP